jgi:trigger factor
MKVSVEAGNGLERRMTVEIPAENVENEIGSRLKNVGRNAKIKGFRPGKVPAKVIQQRYGVQVRQEVLQELIQSSYSSAIEQENLRPASNPTIEPGNLEAGQEFSFTAIFEVYPEITVEKLDALKVEQPETEITDGDVDGMVDTLRQQRVSWSGVDRKSADGDRVTVDFEGKLNDEVFDGGTGSDVAVVIGQGQMLEDFEENLKGLKAGEEKTFKMKFPKDYPTTSLAGEKVSFAITVKEVAESVLPEIDAAFVKEFGIESGEVEAFRADVKANMEREAESRTRADVKRQIMEQLLEKYPVDVPVALVDSEAAALRGESLKNMGIADENDPNAPAVAEFRDAAERRVRLGLLMSTIIKDSELQIDRDLVKEKIDEMAAPYDQPEEIRKIYFQNQQLMGQVENMVLEEQVVAWLVDKASVTTKRVKFGDIVQA